MNSFTHGKAIPTEPSLMITAQNGSFNWPMAEKYQSIKTRFSSFRVYGVHQYHLTCGLLSLLNNLSLLSQHKNINSAINRVCCRIYIIDFISVSLITDWSLPSRSLDGCAKD